MAKLPDAAMKAAAEEIINLIGDDTDFVRKIGGVWTASATIVVRKEVALSEYIRSKMGIEKNTDYACSAPEGSDILRGDRTVIGGIYWEVYSLNDWITHIEFGLSKTGVGT